MISDETVYIARILYIERKEQRRFDFCQRLFNIETRKLMECDFFAYVFRI